MLYQKVVDNKPVNNPSSINSYKFESYTKMEMDVINIGKGWKKLIWMFKPFRYFFSFEDSLEDGTKYVVYFDISKGEMKVDFGVLYEEDDEDDDVDFEIKTNKGNIYRIMSTVISIIRKALSDFKPNQIKISSDPKRIRLYKIYIKNLNGYILTKEDTFNLILQRK